MNDTLRELISIIIITFCLTSLPLAWCIWVFVARSPYDWQPSPHSKTTPLGTYGPRR